MSARGWVAGWNDGDEGLPMHLLEPSWSPVVGPPADALRRARDKYDHVCLVYLGGDGGSLSPPTPNALRGRELADLRARLKSAREDLALGYRMGDYIHELEAAIAARSKRCREVGDAHVMAPSPLWLPL